ncbi:MAG TPA: hypothetical protein VNT56_08165 [Acidimicrobiales bacterium]|nr:hypothetical protein [Acidimicrobiales bacterium]
MAAAGCSGGGDGFLSRSPEASRQVAGGPFCGPLEELLDARRDLIIRATSNLEIESVVDDIRNLQDEIASEAPAELRDEVTLTNRVYSNYVGVLESEDYGKAPMDTITADDYNEAELAQVSFCFQNPGR